MAFTVVGILFIVSGCTRTTKQDLLQKMPVASGPGVFHSATVSAGAFPASSAAAVQTSVLDFGAKDDGTTDSTAAIQKAIDTVSKAGGGVVLFPHTATGSGSYRTTSSLNVSTNAITLQGAGMLATKIFLDSATAIAISANGGAQGASGFSVRDMTIMSYSAASATRTAGSSIYVTNIGNYLLENLFLFYGWDSIIIDHAFSGIIRNVVAKGDTTYIGGGGLNRGILVANGSISTRLRDIYVSSNGTYPAGIQVDSGTDTLFMDGIEISNIGNGALHAIYLTNTGTSFDPRWVRISNSSVEASDVNGVGIDLAKGLDVELTGVYMKGGAIGLHVTGPTRLVRVHGGIAQLAQKYGVLIEGSGNEIEIDGMHVTDNSQAAKNTYAGIEVGPGASNFKLRNIRSGNFLWKGTPQSVGGQRYGIEIQPGRSDFYQITGCDLSVNETGGLSDGGSGPNKIVSGNQAP